jgi:hypothetical protein
MGAIEHNSSPERPLKNAKELEEMLRSALQEKHGATVDDFNVRIFRTNAGLADWNAEIVAGQGVVGDDVKDTFESANLGLQRQLDWPTDSRSSNMRRHPDLGGKQVLSPGHEASIVAGATGAVE